MTNEENLDWLYRLRSEIYVYMPKEWLIPMNEALDYVIKALEQKPCDCINRQELLEAFNLSEKTRKYGGDHSGYNTMMLYEIQDVIEDLPSIQPKPKAGHWKWVQYDYNSKLGDWHCSECKSVVIECVSKEEKGGIPLYKYCPQCGAKMSETPTNSEKE